MKIRPHQIRAVEKAFGVPGFGNFDGMGKGKTASTLFEVRRYREQAGPTRTLVIAPKAAISVWARHTRLILPDTPLIDRGWWPSDHTSQDMLAVTNYEQANAQFLNSIAWDYLVVDEAHYIKNRKAERTKAIKQLTRVKYKRALTGTPIMNHPDDLWSILNFLYPRRFTSYWRFFNTFVDYIHHIPGKQGCPCGSWHTREWYEIYGPKNTKELRSIIAPFVIRRTNPETNIDHQDIVLDMGAKQARAYREMTKDMLTWLETEFGDAPLPAPVVIAQRTRMRQFAASYMGVDGDRYVMTEPSNKLDALSEKVEGTNEPIVVFSTFTQLLNLMAKRLVKKKFDFGMYTGQNTNTRDQDVDRFQSGKLPVMLVNVKAGGVAITLSTGRHAVFLDESWSPLENQQAWDRLFNREDNPHGGDVEHYKSRGTIDYGVAARGETKVSWFKEVLGS